MESKVRMAQARCDQGTWGSHQVVIHNALTLQEGLPPRSFSCWFIQPHSPWLAASPNHPTIELPVMVRPPGSMSLLGTLGASPSQLCIFHLFKKVQQLCPLCLKIEAALRHLRHLPIKYSWPSYAWWVLKPIKNSLTYICLVVSTPLKKY